MSDVLLSKIMFFAAAALVLIAATVAALPQHDGRLGRSPQATFVR